MKIKAIIDEGFQDYKLPYMYIAMPQCNFKCCIEAGIPIETCQNCEIAKQQDVQVNVNGLIKRYLENPITKAIVIGGLEPFDTFESLYYFVHKFRLTSNDDIVIYTGYNKIEILEQVNLLSEYTNIIIKFGRYIPNKANKFDEILGVTLISDNQYAERIPYKKENMFKIIKNPNIKIYHTVTEAVNNNNGYCPCNLEKNENTKCICKKFKEQDFEGYCHCGRYYKHII